MSLFESFDSDFVTGSSPVSSGVDVEDYLEVVEAAPSGAVFRYVASLSYIGSEFHGVAVQTSQRTVLGVLGLAIERALRFPVTMVVAGRTDAGVHAFSQVVSFDAPAHKSGLDGLYHSISRQLPNDVSLNWIGLADSSFSARFSAKYRHYLYRLEPACDFDAIWQDRAWQIPRVLDLDSIRSASYVLIGEHDFSSFCKRPPEGSGNVRRVLDVRICKRGRFIDIEIWANAFCHQMVRGVVGGLVEVGSGVLSVADFARMVLLSGDTRRAPAPAGGLYLVDVGYVEFAGSDVVDPFEVVVGAVPESVYAISSCLERVDHVQQISNR